MNVSISNYKFAESIWTEYALKPHSKHMATLSALSCLSQLMEERKPDRVVEIGGGIGTITCLMMAHEHPPALLCTFEDTPLCLPQLEALFRALNPSFLNPTPDRWRIVKSKAELSNMIADLLVIDGTIDDSDPALSCIRPGTAIFLEGNRGPERSAVIAHVRAKGWDIAFAEDFLFMRDEPVPGKGCWIGTVRR
jgi:hypothetical protein